MATELDNSYYGRHHEEPLGLEDSQDAAIAEMLDHGSISFGRYTVDSLAWEKRSVFTHNRFQEELEKLKAPGLVAQKKAYFEAYYKRIRALKASQLNEQAEHILDCEGDDHVNCQNGEVHDEILIEPETVEASNVATAFLEEHSADSALQMESADVFCCGHSDSVSVVTCHDFSTGIIEGDNYSLDAHRSYDMVRGPAGTWADSSARSFKGIDTGKNSIDSLQCRHWDSEYSISSDDLWRTGIEDTDIKKNCSNSVQIMHMTRESTVLDSPRRIEEIELLQSLCSDDNKWSVKESFDAPCPADNGTTLGLNGPDSLMLKPRVPELPLVDNHLVDKTKALANKHFEHSLTPRTKESVSSVSKSMKTECATRPEAVKGSQRPKRSLHKTNVMEEKSASTNKASSGGLASRNRSTSNSSCRPHKVHSSVMVGKEGKSTHLSKTLCNILPRASKPASVLTNRPPKESSSSVIISCPFSFATLRATTPGGIRERVPQNSYSKSLNGSLHASQPSQQLSLPVRFQSTMLSVTERTSVKKYTAYAAKTAGLEKKSHHGDIMKSAPVLNNHSEVPWSRDGLMQRPGARFAGRSISAVKGERAKEGKANTGPRLFEETPKLASASLGRTNKPNPRKVFSSQPAGLLLDGKRPRQCAKPWR